MIEVCRGEDDAGLPHPRGVDQIGPAARTAATISPDVMGGIKDSEWSRHEAGRIPGTDRRRARTARAG